VAGGFGAAASGAGATAVGGNSTASGQYATAVGYSSLASGNGAVAVGANNTASGAQAFAIGYGNVVSGSNAGASGSSNVVSGNNSYAIGNNNNVASNNTVVLGNNVTVGAGNNNSVVLGNNSVASGANTVSVGAPGAERRITNVAPGAISPTSTDAVNGSQLYAAEARMTGNLTALGTQIKNVQRDAYAGAAAAMAMGQPLMPSAAGKFTYAGSAAAYQGQGAFGASFAYRFDTNAPFAATAGVSIDSRNHYGFRVGIMGEF
jgi:trimeric autotransporter adhesin